MSANFWPLSSLIPCQELRTDCKLLKNKHVLWAVCNWGEKKYKMRGNPVFEPAAECLDLSLIYQPQQFKGKKKSVKSPLSAATRWHRDVPIPHHQASGPHPPSNQKVHLCNFLSSSYEFNGGEKTIPAVGDEAPPWNHARLPELCAQKGTFVAFCTVSQDGVPLHNETIITHIKQRSSVKGHKNKEAMSKEY